MKVIRYQVGVYGSILDFTHGMSQTQDRVYVPETAVIGFRRRDHIDFFSDSEEDIGLAESVAAEEYTEDHDGPPVNPVKYKGEVELPDYIVNKMVSDGRAMNRASELFQESGRKLVEMLISD